MQEALRGPGARRKPFGEKGGVFRDCPVSPGRRPLRLFRENQGIFREGAVLK